MSKLEEVKNDYLTKLKKVKLIEAGIGYEEADGYLTFIDADDEEEIEKQIEVLVNDITQHNTATGFNSVKNKRIWRPF